VTLWWVSDTDGDGMGLRSGGGTAAVRRRSSSRNGTIGLDLGATAVRAAVLGPPVGRGPVLSPGLVVEQLASVPLPPGAISRGVVQDPGAVTAAVRRLVVENRLKGRRVVLGISTPQVVVRSLTLPAMPADKLRQALPFQARDVLPIPLDEALLDFSPLPPTADVPAGAGRGTPGSVGSPSALTPGLLTAAPRMPVMLAVQAVEKAGLTVQRVDLSSFGLLRAIGTAGAAVEALVDIGSELTTIVIHRHGVPHVVRVVAFGGRQLTDRVADGLGITVAEAEVAKCTVGAVGDSVTALQVRDELRALLSEVRASLRFFVTTVGSAVQRVLLTGGTSGLPGLDALLAVELEVPVALVTPLRHLAGAPDRLALSGGSPVPGLAGGPPGGPPGAATAVSVGLALGRAA
jgi:type IV pilus assembly protein PilM